MILVGGQEVDLWSLPGPGALVPRSTGTALIPPPNAGCPYFTSRLEALR